MLLKAKHDELVHEFITLQLKNERRKLIFPTGNWSVVHMACATNELHWPLDDEKKDLVKTWSNFQSIFEPDQVQRNVANMNNHNPTMVALQAKVNFEQARFRSKHVM